ncbi:unnamed protein product [Arabidopsis thaliana]|uniref:(thale cress) hypothetical protein n=1 Tax=Arabidopsis thaliana TaxID=3702 RepID=A0A7G2E2Y4_ARATH|nr:unnamed protein product [Arabidopsis thaliana]
MNSSYLQASRVMVVGSKSPVDRRRKSLERVDKELLRGNYETALSLVKQLKSKHGCLSAFGSAKLLPKKLDMSSKTDLRSLIDSVSRSIESVYVQEDSVRTSKEMEIKTSPEEDWFSVVQHESGHFLVGYLLGVLPRHYEIPTLEAVRQNVSNVTGRVEFVGFEFLKQVGAANQLMKDDVDGQMNQGNISSKVRFPQMDLNGNRTYTIRILRRAILRYCQVERCSAVARLHRIRKGGSYQMGCFQHCLIITFSQRSKSLTCRNHG